MNAKQLYDLVAEAAKLATPEAGAGAHSKIALQAETLFVTRHGGGDPPLCDRGCGVMEFKPPTENDRARRELVVTWRCRGCGSEKTTRLALK